MRELIQPLRQLPILKITCAFVLGLILAELLSFPIVVWVGVSVVSFFLIWWAYYRYSYATRWYFGFVLMVFFCGWGAFYLQYTKSQFFYLEKDYELFLEVSVDENPVETKYGSRWKGRIAALPDSLEMLDGKTCVVYSRSKKIPEMGDLLYAKVRLAAIPEAKNPYEYDFQKYYAQQGIFVQLAIDTVGFIKVGEVPISPITRLSGAIQRYTLQTLKKYGLSGNELGIVAALMVGDKQFLDADTKTTYSNIGAMHMLAVSGMHVGLIYGVIISLLFFIRGRKMEVYKSIVALLALWIYAFVAGLSPSILRATIMFSFIGVGKIVNRDYNTFNLLAASALMLLLYNPLNFFNVGFQLSYAAVISILLFYSKFRRWAPANRMLRMVYDLVAVTVAAQLLTLPICIYYFHQVPLVFIATNLMMMPLVTLIMYFSISLLILSWIEPMAHLLSFCVVGLAKCANGCAGWLSSVPAAFVENIQIDVWQMALLMLAVLFIYMFTIYRSKNILRFSLLLVFSVVLLATMQKFRRTDDRVAIYSMKKGSAILLKSGERAYCICDSVRNLNEYSFMKPSIQKWGVKDINAIKFINSHDRFESEVLYVNSCWFSFHNKTYFVLNDVIPAFISQLNSIGVDYMVVSRGVKGKPENLLKVIKPNFVVLDNSLSSYQRQRWERICKANSIRYHDIQKKGAWLSTFY